MNHELRVVNSNPVWLYVLLQKYPRVAFLIGSLLQMLKANDFDRDGCSTFIVQFPYQKMKAFLFARIISGKNCFQQNNRSGNPQTIFLTSCNASKDAISYLLQSLDKQSLLCNFHISALAFSLLQNQHRPSFLLVLIPIQTIFPTCFNPNLRYFYNFSSFSFYSNEYQFQVHNYQLLLFIYVIKIQLQVIANNFIIIIN